MSERPIRPARQRSALQSAAVALAAGAFAVMAHTGASAGAGPPQGSPGWDMWAYENGWGAVSLMSPPAPRRGMRWPEVWSDGGTENVVFSQDNRRVRLLAFDSDATNFVAADGNGLRDVFVVWRGRGGGNMTGTLERASVARRGAEANGPSRNPSLDGETHASPRCVSFESRATNLDRRDRSSDWDVYVRDLRAKRTRLASRDVRDARNAVVDGRCASVTFESRGRVYVTDLRRGRIFFLARGRDPDQQTNGEGVAYERAGQVWYRGFRLRSRAATVRLQRGRERLVSDTRSGRPGNGRSGDAALDDAGRYVAFESTSTDLCIRRCAGISTDRNGAISDVFRRTISPEAPTDDSMQMVSYSYVELAQGDGASRNPAISGAGENVAFDSEAVNFGGAGNSPKTQGNGRLPSVFSWSFPRRRGHGNVKLVQRKRCQGNCLGPELEPSMSSRGNYIAWLVWMSELCNPARERWPGDRDCPLFTDVFMRWMGPSHEGHPHG